MVVDDLPPPFTRVYTEWREWFAWRPVKLVSGSWVWGKKIYCRKSWLWLSIRGPTNNEYGTLLDVLSTVGRSFDIGA